MPGTEDVPAMAQWTQRPRWEACTLLAMLDMKHMKGADVFQRKFFPDNPKTRDG